MIQTSVILSLAIMGLFICFNWPDMIFTPLADTFSGWIEAMLLPYWVSKPVWSCPTCMSSFWGLVFYIAIGHSYLSIPEMCVVILSTAFLNTLWCVLLGQITDYGC